MNKLTGLLVVVVLLTPFSASGYELTGSFVTIDDTEVDYSSYEGKPLLVEAFLPECSHCHAQHPDLVSLWDNYSYNFTMISLSLTSVDQKAEVEDYLIKYPSTWVVGIDKDDFFQNKFNIPGTPSLVFFDSEGKYASCDVGRMSYENLESNLLSLLNNSEGYIEKNSEGGACEQAPFLQRLIGSFFFPIIFVTVLYALFFLIKKFKSS